MAEKQLETQRSSSAQTVFAEGEFEKLLHKQLRLSLPSLIENCLSK